MYLHRHKRIYFVVVEANLRNRVPYFETNLQLKSASLDLFQQMVVDRTLLFEQMPCRTSYFLLLSFGYIFGKFRPETSQFKKCSHIPLNKTNNHNICNSLVTQYLNLYFDGASKTSKLIIFDI